MRGFIVLFALFAIAYGIIQPTTTQLFNNDNDVLALALTIENFDSAYYAKYLDASSVGSSAFTQSDFINGGYTADDYTLFLVLLANERAHVNLLQETLRARNGTTIPVCTYTFPTVANVNDFVFYSKLFENIGTAAYDGAITLIYNKTLQTAAATVATVEGRHAAFLNTLSATTPTGATIPAEFNITSPFPFAVDPALESPRVWALLAPYVPSCPYPTPFNPFVANILVVAGAGQTTTQSAVNANDVAALNYALTLEILEATFYNRYLDNTAEYGETQFIAAGFTAVDHAYLRVVQAHENMHVAALRALITANKGTPVANCTYNFPVTGVPSLITVAALLETTGVSAYDGAVNAINDATLRKTAAQVATVEARHSAYLNRLVNNTNSFSAATDTPLLPGDVYAALIANQPANGLPLLNPTSCPVPTIPSPILIPSLSNGTSAATTTTSTSGSSTTGGNGGATTTSSAAAVVIAVNVLLISAIALL